MSIRTYKWYQTPLAGPRSLVMSYVHTCDGASASNSGFTFAGCVANRRCSRLWPAADAIGVDHLQHVGAFYGAEHLPIGRCCPRTCRTQPGVLADQPRVLSPQHPIRIHPHPPPPIGDACGARPSWIRGPSTTPESGTGAALLAATPQPSARAGQPCTHQSSGFGTPRRTSSGPTSPSAQGSD